MRYVCRKCKHDWDSIEDTNGLIICCPFCFSEDILSLEELVQYAEEYVNEHYGFSGIQEEEEEPELDEDFYQEDEL